MAELPVAKVRDEIDPDSDLGHMLFDDSPESSKKWIEHFLTVPTEQGQIVPMKLYPQQNRMLNDQSGRDVTVKGRQTRASSLIIARNVRRMTSGQLWGATAVVGAQDDQTTQGVFRKRIVHHIMNDLAHRGFEYKIRDNENETVIEGLENRFVWVSGEQRTMTRGFAAQIIHYSEFAHWKDSALELLGGSIPAVPPTPFGNVDLESTPRGETGAFFDYAMNKSRPLNPDGLWAVHLYPWWLEPRYRVGDDPYTGCDIVLTHSELVERRLTFVPTMREAELMAGHNFTNTSLNFEQILWRRFRKAEMDTTPTPFLQEYPEDLDSCWLGVQGKFFDTPDGIDHLEYYRDNRRQPVRMIESLPYRGDMVTFFGANLAIWEYPDQNDTYVLGFDAAGGGIGVDSDWSVAYVMSVRKEKVVARLRLQASPKVFAAMLAAFATYYKSAMISGERSHHGAMVFEELRDLQYRNIYYYVDPFKPLSKNERLQPGVYPTAENRQKMLERFKTGITNHAIESFCPDLVREMNNFTWQKFQNRMKAQAMDIGGGHDDCIFAAANTWFVIDKARNRLAAHQAEEITVRGPLGIVSRRTADLPRSQQLWLT